MVVNANPSQHISYSVPADLTYKHILQSGVAWTSGQSAGLEIRSQAHPAAPLRTLDICQSFLEQGIHIAQVLVKTTAC